MNASETTLKRLIDERESIQQKHENKLAEINVREDPLPNSDERELLKRYRDEIATFDEQIGERSAAIQADREAEDRSRDLRRIVTDGSSLVEDGDGVVYREFKQYAFDEIVSRTSPACSSIARQWGVDSEGVMAAQQRLQMVKRVPDNTLSSNVPGLIPPQHIAQIFQVINKDRGLVNAARRVDLNRGTLTYPQVDTSPVVLVQSGEKTEGGTTRLAVSMVTKTASTYIGGGDLSWQAINWSTPDALDLWFDLVAADYALKTETDATIVSASGFLNNIASTIGATPTYVELMAAIGAGGGEVWANSGRMANAVICAPDRYWYVMGLATASPFGFGGGQGGISLSADRPALSVIVSRGLNSGEIIVGDMAGLLVAETPGAPVEMRVVEPSIGGVEVGLIGAFEAAVVDDGAFATITTAS